MTDYSELKRLAEAATPGPWVKVGRDEVHTQQYESDGEMMADHVCNSFACGASDNDDAAFVAAANLAAVLTLIAEVEFLKESRKEAREDRNRHGDKLDAAELEIDQLKAQVEALRKDAERYRWLKKKAKEYGQDGGMSSYYSLPNVACSSCGCPGLNQPAYSYRSLSAAIDAAMTKEQG